jgi:hypothetical protein
MGTVKNQQPAEGDVMSKDRISAHEIQLFLIPSSNRIAATTAVNEPNELRLDRAGVYAWLAKTGVLDIERMFPGNKYRFIKRPAGAAKEFLERIQIAREVFGHSAARGPGGN